MEERQWSFSTISMFQTCQRKYYWRKVKGLISATTAPALTYGRLLHECFETFYNELAKGMDRSKAISLACAHLEANWKDCLEDDRRTIANGIKLLLAYEELYRAEPFKILQQEVAFSVPVYYGGGKSFLLSGRLDALIEWNGPIYVLERKSTSQLNSNFFKPFEMSSQLDGYQYAAEQLVGKKVLGVMMDVFEVWKDVKRETAKTKKTEDHFARNPMHRSNFEMKEYFEDMGMVVEDIIRAEKENRFPRNKNACFSYNYRCPYWNLCKYGESESELKNFTIDPKVAIAIDEKGGEA